MSEKKVLCPWCGTEMIITEQQDIFHGKHARYHCLSCEAYAPIGYDEESAYLAATRRPPNLPLSKEQIMGMEDEDVIWYVLSSGKSLIWAAEYVKATMPEYSGAEIMFAAKPTPADIEAARKEKNA